VFFSQSITFSDFTTRARFYLPEHFKEKSATPQIATGIPSLRRMEVPRVESTDKKKPSAKLPLNRHKAKQQTAFSY